MPTHDLVGLAPELVQHIISHVAKRDLKNIRQVNKMLGQYATAGLFNDIFLSPSEESIQYWNKIVNDNKIRHLPRHVTIHTQEDLDVDDEKDYEETLEEGEFEEAFKTGIDKLPNVVSVEIAFTPTCAGDRELQWYELVTESVQFRKEILFGIFQAIQTRSADEKNRQVCKLSIINLQNCPLPDLTTSQVFHDVMNHLEELHLGIAHEYRESGPDHDYTRVELQTFPAYLCSDWLAPIAANLKALSIYQKRNNWGPFPGNFDLSNISFPNLKSLYLGYYTLAHDDQLDWVLAQKSLRTLVLHNCMIASRINIDKSNMEEWNVRTHDWKSLNEPSDLESYEEFYYNGTWSSLFSKITAALPNLVDFEFNYSTNGYVPEEVLNTGGCKIFPERYVVFDNGILPHWPEANSSGELSFGTDDIPNFHQENSEEDQKNLDILIERCRVTAGRLG